MNKVIQDYISTFPPKTQNKLNEMYSIIKEVIPEETEERISRGMPTFTLKRNLVHFAGFKNHISLFPGISGVEEFKKLDNNHKTTKGGIQFSLEENLPKKIIQKVIILRIKEEKK